MNYSVKEKKVRSLQQNSASNFVSLVTALVI